MRSKTLIFTLFITILLGGCQTYIQEYSQIKTHKNYAKVRITKYVLPEQDLYPVWFKDFRVLSQKGDSYPNRQMYLYQSSNFKNLKQLAVFKNSLGKFFVNPLKEKEIFFISFDGKQGIWKSKNLGKTWKQVYYGKAEMLIFHPKANLIFFSSPKHWYAGKCSGLTKYRFR